MQQSFLCLSTLFFYPVLQLLHQLCLLFLTFRRFDIVFRCIAQ